MPKIGNKRFDYTPEGMAAAEKEARMQLQLENPDPTAQRTTLGDLNQMVPRKQDYDQVLDKNMMKRYK